MMRLQVCGIATACHVCWYQGQHPQVLQNAICKHGSVRHMFVVFGHSSGDRKKGFKIAAPEDASSGLLSSKTFACGSRDNDLCRCTFGEKEGDTVDSSSH